MTSLKLHLKKHPKAIIERERPLVSSVKEIVVNQYNLFAVHNIAHAIGIISTMLRNQGTKQLLKRNIHVIGIISKTLRNSGIKQILKRSIQSLTMATEFVYHINLQYRLAQTWFKCYEALSICGCSW